MESLQRLQFDLGEEISRKEYLKRKRKNSKLLRKRSKITYILMAIFMALTIYIVVQMFIYRQYNNFKYTLGEGVNDQAVYNIYFVTEGYTYNPTYSVSSITSLGQDEENILPSSNISQIVVEEDYLYGIRDGAVCRITKDKYEVEELIKDSVVNFIKKDDYVFYTAGDDKSLNSYNIVTKEKLAFNFTHVDQLLADENHVFAITNTPEEKAIYSFNYDGSGQNKISADAKVSYAILDNERIYFVNKADDNKIYSVKTSGDELAKVADIASVGNNGEIAEVNGNKYMFVKDQCLYYINTKDEDTLWRYNFEDKSNEKIISASIEILQNVDNTIFYKIDKEMGVYLYNYDTKFMSLITKRRVKEFVIDAYTDMFQESK